MTDTNEEHMDDVFEHGGHAAVDRLHDLLIKSRDGHIESARLINVLLDPELKMVNACLDLAGGCSDALKRDVPFLHKELTRRDKKDAN